MLVVTSLTDQDHDPVSSFSRGIQSTLLERPQRAEALRIALRDGAHDLAGPEEFGTTPITRVHSPDYLHFLETIHDRWQAMIAAGVLAATDVQGSTFTLRHRYDRVPSGVSAQADYYLSGGWAPVGRGTYDAAVAAANVALTAADRVLAGERAAYALCRPPGHHAYADLGGGFCYLNNVAIAAEHVTGRLGSAAILDIDVHHGNGTQDIFYDRGDVHFVSIHADPEIAYPFYCGFADELGEEAGLGHTLNLPLPSGARDDEFLEALEPALRSIRAFGPPVLLVSLGLDAYEHDPTALFRVSTDGFRRIGARIGREGLPIVLVQEGGYAVDDLGANLLAFLEGVSNA